MVTAQSIQEKAFEKSRNGYDMGQVDEFLDELAADVGTLTKENAELKSKLKVLVQKIDEYRQTEDSMRLALLSAQKLSAQIESEARERADKLTTEAQQYADQLKKKTDDSMANEYAKLEEAKKATNKFFDHMRAVCRKQIDFYDQLGQMTLVGGDEEPEEAEEPAQPPKSPREQEMDETVRSIADAAEEAALEEPREEPAEQPAPAPAPTAAPEEDVPAEEEEPTRLYPPAKKSKRRRSFDDFSFEDDI